MKLKEVTQRITKIEKELLDIKQLLFMHSTGQYTSQAELDAIEDSLKDSFSVIGLVSEHAIMEVGD